MKQIPTNPLHRRRHPMAGPTAIRGFIAGALIALLAACGGGGGGGSGSTTPPPPPPGPGAPSSYYLSGASGGDNGHSLALTGVEPVSGSIVNIPDSNLYSGSIATIAEWTAANGAATSAGTRYRVWAGSDGQYYNTDLADPSGSAAPTTTQFSTYPTASVCAGVAPTVLNDLAKPANSAIVFRDGSGTNTCGAPTDKFVTLPLSATATTTPPAPSINEPVAVGRDATGAITKVLFVIHSTPTAAVGYASSFSATPTVIATLSGTGVNLPTGDFASLAVVLQSDGSLVWVYRDVNQFYAVNLTTLGTPQLVYSAADNDTLQLPLLVQGSTIYFSMADTTNNVAMSGPPAYTCQIVAVTTAIGATANNAGHLVIQENTAANGLTLLGILGNNIVYFNDNVVTTVTNNVASYSGSKDLEFVPTSTSNGMGTGTAIDHAVWPNTFDSTSPPIVVGNGLYYAIDTPQSSILNQAYYYTSGTPVAVGGTNGGVVLGGVVAASTPTANQTTPLYSSAILVLEPQGGNLPSAQIVTFDGSGHATATLGALPTLTQGDSYTGLALSEPPVQSGMPALILASGQHNGNTAQDLIEITPGKAGSLHAVTNNLQ